MIMKIALIKPLIVIMLFLLNACAQKDNHFSVDPALQEYYDSFMKEAKSRGRLGDVEDLVMRFSGDLGSNSKGQSILAQCTTSDGGTPTIEVDKAKWNSVLGGCQKYALVFHELGHCLLDREHRNDLDSNGIAVSLMHENLVSEAACSAKYGDYINELFN